MFASLLALALAAQQITIPLGKAPRQIERPQRADRDSRARNGPRPARIRPTGTSPRRRSGSTATPIWSAPAAFPRSSITGDDGHVLIDGGHREGRGADRRQHPRSSASSSRDIKYLLISHEHFDHVGGIARLQQLTGATLVASAPAAKVLEHRRCRAPTTRRPGCTSPSRAANVGRVIADGEEVRLRQSHADRDDHARPHAGRAQLALGKLRRRGVPDDGLCRQPVAGQPRRLQVSPTIRPISPPIAPRSPRSPPAAARSC